jgi:hypothetical protein
MRIQECVLNPGTAINNVQKERKNNVQNERFYYRHRSAAIKFVSHTQSITSGLIAAHGHWHTTKQEEVLWHDVCGM